MYIYIYIYIHICMCVYMCVCFQSLDSIINIFVIKLYNYADKHKKMEMEDLIVSNVIATTTLTQTVHQLPH